MPEDEHFRRLSLMKSWNGCIVFYDIIIVIIILVMPVSPWCVVTAAGWRVAARVARWRWWRPAVILSTLRLPRAVPATRPTHHRDT